ncbi:MAG: hypothetical protein JRM80_11405 [Nitrososphaerota archaeon]|nr:hypothetical protein [Nitrososphaerota archaeon]MDG6990130.1 hypothetical protein [Nitrososphaerota archaeon]
MTRTNLAVAIAAAAGLLALDVSLAASFLQSDILRLASSFELAVFGAQFVKTVLVLGVKRIRNGGPSLAVDIYGAEALAMPVLLAASFAVGLGPVGSLLTQLFLGWMAGVAFAGLPYAAFRIGRSMARSAPLSSVLPAAVATSEFGVLFVSAAATAAKSHTGLAGVAGIAVSALLGRGSVVSGGALTFAALADVYGSLLLYAVLGLGAGVMLSRVRGLAMSVAATAVTLVWVFALLPLAGTPIILLLPPSIAVAGVSWWIARGQ